ncbi:MAG: tetratricopeptide repeat protein [Calditrichaeota bacterium]|nr:MAG: tetratricopeptide repeat protein [Calditrichota bacterium]
MKTNSYFLWISVLLSILIISGICFAQYDDELLLEDQTDMSCIPENLNTIYDSLATGEVQDVKMEYSFGTEYYKNKNYKEAVPYLWKAFLNGDDQYSRAAVRKLADSYFSQSMVDSTLIVCYKGLEKFPDLTTLHHYAGSLQNTLGKVNCAIPHFENLVQNTKEGKELVEYLKTLALLYLKNNDERAVDMQKRVVELVPDDAEQSDLLASMMDMLVDPEEALAQRKENFTKFPDNTDYALDYGDAAVRAGKFEEAIKPLSVAISKDPKVKAYNLRAQAYESLGSYSKAINDYKSALNLEPSNADLMLNIANNYKFLNNFSSAKYWVGRALGTKPGYGKAYITMGEIIEASVPYCQKQRKNSKTTFEDKLVYEKAKEQYDYAKRDPAYNSKARNKINYLQSLLPTKEDRFMNQGKSITSSCYDFVK